jgi:Uma2 family endonuclease
MSFRCEPQLMIQPGAMRTLAPAGFCYYMQNPGYHGAAMNVAVARAADGLPRRAFTVDDIHRMLEAGIVTEDERFELIEGDLVMMAAKGYAHELIKRALTVAIARALPDDMTLGPEMTIQFTDRTLLEPDLTVFRRRAVVKSAANFSQILPGELLLAIEVAASSLAYDKGFKGRLYARHGVQEFWVVDANERITWIHTGPSADGWSSVIERGPQELLTTPALPNFSIRLEAVD